MCAFISFTGCEVGLVGDEVTNERELNISVVGSRATTNVKESKIVSLRILVCSKEGIIEVDRDTTDNDGIQMPCMLSVKISKTNKLLYVFANSEMYLPDRNLEGESISTVNQLTVGADGIYKSDILPFTGSQTIDDVSTDKIYTNIELTRCVSKLEMRIEKSEDVSVPVTLLSTSLANTSQKSFLLLQNNDWGVKYSPGGLVYANTEISSVFRVLENGFSDTSASMKPVYLFEHAPIERNDSLIATSLKVSLRVNSLIKNYTIPIINSSSDESYYGVVRNRITYLDISFTSKGLLNVTYSVIPWELEGEYDRELGDEEAFEVTDWITEDMQDTELR